MKDIDHETSEGLNQIFEIINAKGDSGEIKEILDKTSGESGMQTSSEAQS